MELIKDNSCPACTKSFDSHSRNDLVKCAKEILNSDEQNDLTGPSQERPVRNNLSYGINNNVS